MNFANPVPDFNDSDLSHHFSLRLKLRTKSKTIELTTVEVRIVHGIIIRVGGAGRLFTVIAELAVAGHGSVAGRHFRVRWEVTVIGVAGNAGQGIRVHAEFAIIRLRFNA